MPGGTDKMTRDVRASLKDCAAKGGKYFKGTAALFLRSGSEYVGGQLPTVIGMVDTNREILQDTARFLRNPVDSINRTINKAMGTSDFKALRKFGENMLDDLRTGNLYDPDRVRSSFGEEVDGLLDSFGDFDMSGFDENGDWSEPEGEEEWEKQLKLAEAQEGSASERTGATIDAISTGTQAIVANDNANAQTNIRMSLKQHSQLMSAAQNMITQQAAAVQAVNQTATSILEVTRETHNQVMDSLKGITALLTEIKQNTSPPVQERDKVRESIEVFGPHGEINIANLLKSAKKKADDKYHISSMMSMATGGMSIADLLETVGNDPWQLVTDALFRQMMPKSLKRQFEITGKKLEGFFPALLTKWGEAGKRFDSGESENMVDFVKGLLGYDEKSRKYIDQSMRNVTAPAVFTNKSAKALEEVIPALLSQIHTDLTGDSLKAFNYGTGQFDKVLDIIAQQSYSANDLANRMGAAASELIDMTKAVKFSDVEMEKRFDQFRYQFLQKAAEDNRFLDPYQDRDKFREAGPRASSINETELFSDIMQRALMNMGQAGLENLSAEIIDARRSRNSANASINNNLRDNGQMIAFSGLIDRALQNEVESKTRKIGGGLRGRDMDDVVEAREKYLARAGVPRANNITLNSIRSLLERGIITYTYILGGTKGMSDDVKGNALAAQKASQKGWSDYQDRILREKESKERSAQSIKDENERRAVKMKDPTRGPAEVYADRDGIDWMRIDMAMKYNQINRAEREDGELVIDNVGVRKFEQDTPEGAKRTLAKRQAELSRQINNRLDNSGFKGFRNKIQEYGKVPFELVENGLKLVDSFLFRILYGEDASDVLLDGHKLPSILDAVRINVKAQWLSAKNWFAENIGNPLKHSLLDANDGLIPQIGNRLNQLIVDPAKKRATDIKNKLIGTRDTNEDGKPVGDYKGGKFSNQINKIRNRASELTGSVKDRISGAKTQGNGFLDRILYGGIKQGDTETTADGVMNRTKYRYDKGKRYVIREQETEYGWQEFAPVFDGYVGAAGAFRKAVDKFNDMMFGPDENGDDHGSREKFNLVKDELKKAFPDMTIGAGVGIIGSLFLPGGPILGALLGSAGGFVASSEAFKDAVFGKLGDEKEVPDFNWETGKFDKTKKVRERSGGMIDGPIVEAFKKFAPKIAIGSGLGLIGSLFLPGGPFLGALMGGIGGMSVASDRMKQMLFGTYTDADGNEKDGLFGPKTRKAIANAVGPALGGAAIGAASWGLISNIGLIPGLSLLPGGPILAFLGGVTGAMNADAIKNYFFGEESEVTEEIKDENGNPTGQTKKTKKRVGGLFGKAFDFARDKMLTPFTQRINAAGAKVGEWFTKSVVTPFQNALEPMKNQFRQAGQAISDSMKNIGEHIKDSIAKMFSNPNDPEDPREQMKKFFKEKIVGPLDRLVSGIFNAIGKVIGGIVSAPFKAMELIFAGTVGGKTLDEISEERTAARKEKEKARNKKRAEKMANRRNGRFSRITQGIEKRFGSIFSRRRDADSSDTSSDHAGTGDTVSNDRLTGDGGDTTIKSQVSSAMNEEARRAAAIAEANRGPDKEGVNVARNRNRVDAESRDTVEKEKRDAATREERDRMQQNADRTSSGSAPDVSTSDSKASAEAGSDGGPAKRKGIFRGKSNNGYLKDIAKNTEKIFGEIKGQLGGSGWNIAYIKTLLDKKFGKLSDDELPEEMEGSKSVSKRRGVLGRVKDKVFGIAGAARDRVQSMVEGAIGIVLTPFRAIGKAVELVKDGVVGAAKTMWEVTKTAGSVLKELAIGVAKGLGGVIAGAGKMISGAAKGFGRALGDVLSTLTGVLHDGILAISGVLSGLVQFAGAMIPEVGMGIWNGLKFIGKGAGKVAGLAWKGIKGTASLAKKGVVGAVKGVKAGAGWLADKITGRGKDKEGKPRGGSYPISISTKAAPLGATSFPVMNMAMPVKPTHAIPVFLVGVFNDVAKQLKDSGGAFSGNESPTLPQLPSGSPDQSIPSDTDESNRSKLAMRNRIAAFKRKYFSVDRRAEKAGTPAEEYDRAVQTAQTDTDIQAIQAAQQMNANNTVIATGNGEGEKKKGILDSIMDLVTGGGGIMNFLRGKGGGLLTGLGSMFAGSRVANMMSKGKNALGLAADFVKTGSKGLLPIALGTMVGEATGTEDRHVTNAPKAVAKVIKNLFTDKNAVDAAGNITRVGWGTRIANFAHETGKKLLGQADAATRGLAAGADDVVEAGTKSGLLGKAVSFLGEKGSQAFNFVKGGASKLLKGVGSKAGAAVTAAKNSDGLVGKLLTKICDIAGKVFAHPIVKKIAPKKLLDVAGKVINKFKAKLGKALVGVTSEGLQQFAKKLGLVVTVVTSAYDFVSGFNEAANILKIDSSNLTTGMRFAAGGAKFLSGLAFGLIPVSWLTEMIYDLCAGKEDENKLDQSQAEFKEKAAQAGMSLTDYNNQQNKSTWRQITDTAASAGKAAKDVGTKVVNAGKSALDWAGGLLPWNWGKGPGDAAPVTTANPLFEYVKGVVSSAVSDARQIASNNGLDTSSIGGMLTSMIKDPKAALQSFLTIGQGIGSSLIDMVTSVFRDKKKGPTIFSIMGEGLGNSLVTDLKNTEGKNATITNAMGTAMAATVGSTSITEAKSTTKKSWFSKTVDKVKGLFGKGPGSDADVWGTGRATPMSQSSGKWNRGSDTMAKTGCGPTAAAIVASAYGSRNANPSEADAMSRRMGMRASDGGTNPDFYSKYAASHGFGMSQGPVDASRISSSLRGGKPVVMMGKGGAYGKNMHYMVAENGKGNSVGLIDPLTGGRKSTTLGKLLGNTKTAVYSFGKGSGWGKGYEDEAENYDENGNLKGVDDPAAAKLAAQTGISYTAAKGVTSKSGGNPLNKPFKVTSPFGTRTLDGKVEGHKGIDLVPADGSGQADVGSRWNGTVSYVVRNIPDSHTGLKVSNNTGGNMVFIKTDDGYTAKHMHLKAGSIPDAIEKGARVKIGQKLGTMGTTGRSTGPHLHYQLEDQSGTPFNPYSSISGGDTMSGFTDGYTSGNNAMLNASGSGATSMAGVAGGIGAAGILSALGTVFSSVSDKLGGILSVLMGGNMVDDAADADTSGDLSSTGSNMLSGAISGVLGTAFNFGASAGNISATESKNTIWKWLRREYGLTEPATAGLMGCWEHESGNRADRLEGDYLKQWKSKWSSVNDVLASNTNLNDYTKNYLFPAYDRSNVSISKSGYRMDDGNYYPGVGLAQWTRGRAYNLLKYAKSMNMDWRDVNTQLAFFRYETSKSYPNLKAELNAETTPENAARAALDGFEMYKGWSSKPKGQKQWAARAKSAAQIYNTYKGTQVTDKGDPTKSVIYQGKTDPTKLTLKDSLKVPTMTDIASSIKTPTTGAAGVGGEVDDEWGTGPSNNLGANVQAMNHQITQINRRMEKVRQDAAKESTVAEVTKKITDAITSTDSPSQSDKLLSGIAAMMAQMVEHLAAIRENTEKKDKDEDTTQSKYPKVRVGNPVYPNGDNEVDDVGAATIDSMTGI